MPHRLPGDDPLRWRCLDSLAWALAALACTLYLPQVGRTYLGDLGLLYVGPAFWALGSVMALGEPAGLRDPWQAWRLRAAWLALAGLAPFVGWWLRCPDRLYLALASLAAMLAAAWALLETANLVSRLARARALSGLVLEALLTRVGLLYLLVIPMLALWVTFGIALVAGWATVPGDWMRFWRQIPPWGRVPMTYAPLLALLNLARLLVRAASGFSALPPSVTAPAGDDADEPSETPRHAPDCRP